MRRLDLLISESRRETENIEFSETAGIPDSEFIRWSNDAQGRIVAKIVSVYPDFFRKSEEIQAVAGQEEYSIPGDAYMGTRVAMVEWSPTGNARDYGPLTKGNIHERVNGQAGTPSFYIRQDRSLLIQPAPSQSRGKFRVTYVKQLPRLDIRRGKIGAVTLDGTTRTITSISLDPTTLDQDNIDLIQNEGYLTLVDKDGVIQMQGLPISSIDPATGLVVLDGAFVYGASEGASVGNYVCSGKFATTHCQLTGDVERYITAHMDWKGKKRDSSKDSIEANGELNDILNEIVTLMADGGDEDITYVPIIDTDYLDANGGF